MRREQENGYWIFRYYLMNAGSRSAPIFETESWLSYDDQEWWPVVMWIDEHAFLTLSFNGMLDEKSPQNEGMFSIVRIDLNDRSGEVLYSASDINPFPRFVISPSGSMLYFQKLQGDTTELWRLNLVSRNAEMIYQVEGDLGEVRVSSDESSLVFTQLLENNFDIIRLDINSDRIER